MLALAHLATRHAQICELRHAEQVWVCSLPLCGTGCVSAIAVVAEAARVLVAHLVLIPKADTLDGAARVLLIPLCALLAKELIACFLRERGLLGRRALYLSSTISMRVHLSHG